MRIYKASCVAVTAALALALTAPIASAQLEDIKPVTLDFGVLDDEPVQLTTATETSNAFYDRIDQVEYKVAMLETRPCSSRGSCSQRPIPSRRISTNSLRNPRTYGGFELAILKPYTSSLSASIPLIPFAGVITPEYEFEVSPRVYLGRERCDGLGIRATYWEFDHRTKDVGIGGTWIGLDVYALDLEITNRIEFCGCDFMFTGGLRYGDLETDLNVPPLGGSATFSSDGFGPTIGATLRRGLARPNLDLVVGGRGSLLLTDATVAIPGLISVDGNDSTMQIWEARIGLEYTRQMRGKMQLETQLAFEAQNWQSGAIAGLIAPNFGLAGPTVRVGVSF